MKEISLKRQLRVNHKAHEKHPDRSDWWFLIIDKKEEIKQLEKRVYSLFNIGKADYELEGRVRGSSMDYLMLKIESKKRINVGNLLPFSDRVVFDPHLYNRNDKEGLEKYIHEMI